MKRKRTDSLGGQTMSQAFFGKGALWGGVVSIFLASATLLALATPATAQNDLGSELFSDFSLEAEEGPAGKPVTWTARYFAESSQKTGRIEVEAKLANRWHIYSLTQKPGGPLPTKLSIKAPESVQTRGPWTPDAPPAKSVSQIYGGLTVEEHAGSVVWSAPISLPADYRGEIQVAVEGLVCKTDGSCVPVEPILTAERVRAADDSRAAKEAPAAAKRTAAGDDAAAGKDAAAGSGASEPSSPPATPPSSSFRAKNYVVQWTATVDRQSAAGDVSLVFTANPDSGYHVYKAAVTDAESATIFVVTEKSGLKLGKPRPDSAAVTQQTHPVLPPVSYHLGEVSWSLPIEAPPKIGSGPHRVAGLIAYQACTDKSCRQPKAMKFTATFTVGPGGNSLQLAEPIELAEADHRTAADAAATTQWVDEFEQDAAAESDSVDVVDGAAPHAADPAAPTSPQVVSQEPPGDRAAGAAAPTAPMSFPLILLLAFAGGVILNVMPCVLPVVGLKVMSFVQQAGEDRRRVLMLNVVYTLGILSVFALLAGLAVALSFSWGEQFTYFPVRFGLALVLFALALSYLGVWEIPVPGMAQGKASQELQSQEGYPGAFAKGVFATILATPCSGPLLGYILGLTLGLSALHTVVIIMAVGVGMSLPYVIIGLQPRLVSWLPQPGPWMETVKQFLAFLFLGTVAFFFAGFNDEHKVPVFVSLIGVWFGCWLIGQVPNWQSLNRRLLAWAGGIAAAAVISMAAFHYLVPGPKVLAWEPYSEARLNQLRAEGRTVLVDFSAKWCVNCIVNYNVAINTPETREVMDELDAVALYADWTDRNPEIKAKLEELNSRSIPLLAIYPGDQPNQPIVLRDLVSQSDVVQALHQAGGSISGAELAERRSKPHEVVQLAR